MGKLRRWNIINDTDDFRPEEGETVTRTVPKSPETKDVLTNALKVR
jgi:hypothetical protein